MSDQTTIPRSLAEDKLLRLQREIPRGDGYPGVTQSLVRDVDHERLEAAQMEWQRHHRVQRVLGASIAVTRESLQTARTRVITAPGVTVAVLQDLAPGLELLEEALQHLEGIAEVLNGEWLHSPESRASIARLESVPDPAEGAAG